MMLELWCTLFCVHLYLFLLFRTDDYLGVDYILTIKLLAVLWFCKQYACYFSLSFSAEDYMKIEN